jgi:hypothetical protein
MEVNEIWYGCYAIGHYSILIIPNVFHSVIPLLRMLKVARWDVDDTIIHDPLRMRITDLTLPNPS